MEDLKLGIDLGGTKILAVIADKNNNIIARAKAKTKFKLGPDAICEQMKKLSDEICSKAEISFDAISAIGIAVPSSIDPETGECLHAPNLGWKNQPIKKTLEKVFGREIYLQNDVNCGTYAEFRLGAASGFSNVVGYFVGTGLGGGIILNGKLVKGIRGSAGELGHEKICFGGRKCGCGARGCLEAYCSKTAFAKRLHKEIEKKKRKSVISKLIGKDADRLKSSSIARALEQEDKLVKEVVSEGFEALGVAIANITSILAPECIVIGGGVVEALGKQIMPMIWKGYEKNVFAINPDDVQIRLSKLGDDAVPLGAALNAEKKGDI